MSAGHTEGPWEVRTTARGIGNLHWREIADENGVIAEVYSCADESDAGEPCEPEAEANARLIAAAPELLEALEAALDGLRRASRQLSDDHKFVLNGKPWGGLLIDNAERAIRKARGEA